MWRNGYIIYNCYSASNWLKKEVKPQETEYKCAEFSSCLHFHYFSSCLAVVSSQGALCGRNLVTAVWEHYINKFVQFRVK